MAPEIIMEEKYDQGVDVWSVGIITYILLTGRPPFTGKTKEQIFESIKNDPLLFEPKVWKKISPEAREFVEKALVKDKTKRPSSCELINHPWIKNTVKNPEMHSDVQLNIANQLKEFKVIP